jgi:hypothetical protein
MMGRQRVVNSRPALAKLVRPYLKDKNAEKKKRWGGAGLNGMTQMSNAHALTGFNPRTTEGGGTLNAANVQILMIHGLTFPVLLLKTQQNKKKTKQTYTVCPNVYLQINPKNHSLEKNYNNIFSSQFCLDMHCFQINIFEWGQEIKKQNIYLFRYGF